MSKIPTPDSLMVVPNIGILMFTFVPAPVMEVHAGAPTGSPGTLVTFVSGFWDMAPGLRSVLVSARSSVIDWRHVGEVFNMGTEPAQLVARMIATRLRIAVTPHVSEDTAHS
jgi:hypothetical protein